MPISRRLLSAAPAALLTALLPAQAAGKVHVPDKVAHSPTKGQRQHQRLARPACGSPIGHGAVGPLTAVEVERNDTIGLADDFGANPDYDGDISFPGDTDVVRYQLTTASVVTFDVSQSGGSPIADATLLLRDARGQFVAYNDDRPSSLLPLLTVPLPAGDYYATIQGYGGANTGTYKLTTTAVPATFAAAALNGPTSGTVPAGGEVTFRLSLPLDTLLRMTVTANGGQDLYCVLLRPSGAVQRFVDDGVTGSLDPSLDTHLPGNASGDYLLSFGDFNGVGGPITFNLVTSQQSVPAVTCGSSVSGSVAGSEGQAMFAMTLTAATATSMSVAGITMTDSWLTLYDADLNTILYDDDDSTSLFSLINVGLPAGTYYVGVEAYSNTSAGSFNLNLACTAGFAPTPGRFGDNAGNIAANGDTAVLSVQPGTPIALEASVAPGALFPMAAVIDASGRCVSFDDLADLQPSGARVASGEHWLLVRDYFAAPGAFNALIGGPTYFFGTTKGNLTMQDKAGRIHFAYAAVSTLPGGFPVPAPFTGNLLILPPLIAIPAVTIPPAGTLTYPFTFPNGPYFLQALSVVTVPSLGGAMTNVAR